MENGPGIITFSPWLSILAAAGLGDGDGAELGIPSLSLVRSPAGVSCPPARGASTQSLPGARGRRPWRRVRELGYVL